MKCLPPTIMNNYITCFRMLTYLGVNNIWATGVLSKNRLRKCTIVGQKQPQKRNVDTLNSAHQAKNAVQLWQWLVWTTKERCTLLLLNFLNLRDLFGVWRKLKESMFQNSNQINSTVTTRTGFFSKGWTRAFPSTRLIPEWKNGGDPRLLQCSMFRCWMLFFRMYGRCITLTKMKSMSLWLS